MCLSRPIATAVGATLGTGIIPEREKEIGPSCWNAGISVHYTARVFIKNIWSKYGKKKLLSANRKIMRNRKENIFTGK